MQEFLEKARALNDWNWQGSPWQYLLYIGVLLVLLFSKRKIVRLILGWLPLLYLICIYNPLFMTGMEMMGVGDRQYFVRMFSFMPLMYAIAAGIVFLIGRIQKSWLKFIVVSAVCAGLVFSGRSIYDQSWFVRAQNFAKVPNDAYEVVAILENTEDENISVATFDPITNYMRQVSNVITDYARHPGQIWYLLNADPPDVKAVMKLAGELAMDYITSRRTEATIQAFRDAGYEPFALTDNMAIYEVTGVRKIVRTFNDKRQIVSVTAYDAEGNIEKNNLGYATIAYEYDERGYQTKITFLDEECLPVMISWGYAEERREYSPQGLILSVICVDTEGKPVLNWGRYVTRNEYDIKGRLIRESYFDANGNPMSRTDAHFASREINYNRQGLIARERFYDVQGNVIPCLGGYAEVHREYDENKRLVSERYYDQQGVPIMMSNGYAEVHWIYDGSGNQISETYYDTGGNSITYDGYHEIQRSYNDLGDVIEERTLDVEGNSVSRDGGAYAIVRKTYNSQHQVLTESYFDIEGNPVNNSLGYATIERTYDGWNLVEEIERDVDGNIV